MKTVLLPVKDFAHAKQRLSAALSPEHRASLARTMYADVLRTLAATKVPERIVVFTACGEAGEMAEMYGFDVIPESSPCGHSAAVNFMLTELSPGSERILAIAADLPRLLPDEIDFVMDHAAEPITILHSRDGDGTNGLLFISPARIEVEYGPGSFARHLSKAAAAGFRAGVMHLPGIGFDLDTPEDLADFMGDPLKTGATWRFLHDIR